MKRGDKLDVDFFKFLSYLDRSIKATSVIYLTYHEVLENPHVIEIKIEDRFFIRHLSDDDLNRYKTYKRTKIIEDLLND